MMLFTKLFLAFFSFSGSNNLRSLNPVQTNGTYPKSPGGFTVSADYSTGCVNPGQIALTFDDGPGQYSRQLLDILKVNNVTASFFLIGNLIPNYSDVVSQAFADGHIIGDHSYTHANLSTLKSKAFNYEIAATSSLIYNATGKYPKFFRFPYYAYTQSTLNYVLNTKKMIVFFDNLDTKDYVDTANWLNTYNSSISASNVSIDSFIVLNHEIYTTTVDQVNSMIAIGKNAGYKFVSLEECIGFSGYF
jgi:peptidoglycan/xylan/chitin deacetylase (PgdA/CDA1 family)